MKTEANQSLTDDAVLVICERRRTSLPHAEPSTFHLAPRLVGQYLFVDQDAVPTYPKVSVKQYWSSMYSNICALHPRHRRGFTARCRGACATANADRHKSPHHSKTAAGGCRLNY